MSQPQGPLIEARPKGRLEPRLSPRTRRLVELLVEAEFQARKPRPKRPPKGQPATRPAPEAAQAPTIASLCIHAGYADTDAGYSAARRDAASPQARAYRAQLRHMALDDQMGAVIGNIASIAMGNSSSDKAQIEAFDALVRYQQATLPKGEQAVRMTDYEVVEHEASTGVSTQGPEADAANEDPGFGKAGGRAGGESPLTSDLPMVTYDEAGTISPEGWDALDGFRPGPDIAAILRGAGYEVVEGAEAVLAAVNGEVRPDEQ